MLTMPSYFAMIAKVLELPNPDGADNPVANSRLAKNWLIDPKKRIEGSEETTKASWLLVFDNADDPKPLEEYWPIFASGSGLITCRDRLTEHALKTSAVESIEVKSFDKEEGSAFLRRLSGRHDEIEASIAISKEFGGLPLALAQLAGIVKFGDSTLAEVLEQYKDWMDRKDLMGYSAQGRINLARGTISSIFGVDRLEPDARCLLELCSVLDPDCIQERLFTNFALRDDVVEGFPRSNFAYSAARTELLRSSLIQRNEMSKEFEFHRAVQVAVRTNMTTQRRDALLKSAIQLLRKAWGSTAMDQRDRRSAWKNREELFPHVLKIRNLYKEWNPSEASFQPGFEFAELLSGAAR